MTVKRILNLIFFLSLCAGSHAQDVPVYNNFEQISSKFTTSSDSIYVINFWATWCKPCVAELPYFEDLYQKFSDRPVKVILISLDDEKKVDRKLKPFLKKRSIQSEVFVLSDPKMNSWIGKVDDNWSGTIPATLIFNKSFYSFTEGEFEDYEALESTVLKFLKS